MSSQDLRKTVPYFGQFGADRVIESYFPPGFVGNCIEVGAIDGIFLSNTAHFELLGWNCLCIEPQGGAGYFSDLAKNRQRAIQCAISAVNADDVEFHVVFCNGKPWSGMSGLLLDERLVEQHRQQGYDIHFDTARVPTRRLDWCIERYFNHPQIDFMSIDVEGSELDVLQSFDLRAYGTRLYVIENNFDDPAVPDFMRERGFVRHQRIEVNDFYIPAGNGSR